MTIAPRPPAVAVAVVALAAVAIVLVARSGVEPVPCGPGFVREGPRCCPTPPVAGRDRACAFDPASSCPAPLVRTDAGCDAKERDVVEVPAVRVTVGPSDWEAEGRVAPRTVDVGAFVIDRLEVTTGRACASDVLGRASFCRGSDPAQAASGVTFAEARAYCASRGGRLPTDDEWLAAAGGERPRRYPWGDTGAVCRRAAWGLERGPCAEGATGPDTVGAHPDGATPLGVHDLAGNVAEWVEVCAGPRPADGPCTAAVRGGSWRTRLATELRTWLRREAAPGVADPTIGFRCAYDTVR
mgnify:CR=1 FL=1